MADYYKILGVGTNSTDQEIKDAYRELAKKYHPDNYSGTPLEEVAKEKMAEVNEAFDAIMNQRRGGGYNSSSNSSNGNQSSYPDIRNLISANRLVEAEDLLNGIRAEGRNAEWYYLKGSIFYSRGWFEDAENSFQTACNMDPYNTEYRSALGRMQSQRQGNMGGFGGGAYRQPMYNGNRGYSPCDCCTSLICADCCCECLGGDLIACC